MALQVELVSPERILYSGEADMVVCRTEGGGEIAFHTGHAPFLGALTIAQVKVVPPETCYVTVRKRREKGRVVEVVRTLVFGTLYLLGALLRRSTASTRCRNSSIMSALTMSTRWPWSSARDGLTLARSFSPVTGPPAAGVVWG